MFAVFLGGMSISFFAMSLVVTEIVCLPFLSNHYSIFHFEFSSIPLLHCKIDLRYTWLVVMYFASAFLKVI